MIKIINRVFRISSVLLSFESEFLQRYFRNSSSILIGPLKKNRTVYPGQSASSMFKLIKEKLKRLLDTRKKRLAAGGLFLVALAAVGAFLYVIFGGKAKTKKVVVEEKQPDVTLKRIKKSEATKANENNVIRPLQGKQGKRSTCDGALAALDSSVKAIADQVTLESLLDQVEELCPEEKYHLARISLRNIDINTEAGIRTGRVR